ncbi:MFS transporter [Chitinophaga qingshengii]|uniref:MFS transporter n=1 Tax=Chitinophaga qingshengii TaxID=1569794 RepID=A0ABR7TGC2_9BACT|nr:MFS transporter [Chitinophaga qingshengii]MBC9929434.1 MFS transporter [Chitinophaga qingshengii]
MNRLSLKWLSLVIVSTSVFLAVIDIFIVNVALPSIRQGVQGTESDMQLIIALYLLGYAAFLITGGRLGDHYGKKRVFIVSMLVFTFSSLLCGIAQTAWQLNTARFIQGISAAFMIPQGISYIHVLFPEHKERIKALGVYGSIAGSASVIGQFLGGILPDIHWIVSGWRLLFLINLPLGLAAALLAARYLTDTVQQREGRFDISGVALLTIALFGLVYPLIRGRESGWPLWSILALAGAVGALFLFRYDQQRKLSARKNPLIDMQLFSYKDFNIALCAVLFYFMVQDSYFLINAIFMQTGLGYSSSETGVLFVFQGVGYVVASLLSIPLVKRYGKRVLQGGVLIMMVSLVMHLVFFSTGSIPKAALPVILFFYGTGCGSVLPSLLTMALKSIPVRFAGAASGTFSTFQQTAIALGIGVSGGIFFSLLGHVPSLAAYMGAYQVATGVNIGFLALVSIFLYILPEGQQTTTVTAIH